ncbi:hypothetical protein CHLRE_18g749897v5 [Chlamydomonas reinhardtii]|uniref:Uncharacterized protein n=1 Tax=Chlamydomonas reinhardtii TaxID=3055 RepID=A0A2K3CNL0_CHLRE|nr:uncharacterized protein CHLRE_18g749897v5 [Chlamydomonas reinhardtii]PNW69866.1 hypothetical protein CHLRE_18g749897v5 [Chlamydomonas reinhardtii]
MARATGHANALGWTPLSSARFSSEPMHADVAHGGRLQQHDSTAPAAAPLLVLRRASASFFLLISRWGVHRECVEYGVVLIAGMLSRCGRVRRGQSSFVRRVAGAATYGAPVHDEGAL